MHEHSKEKEPLKRVELQRKEAETKGLIGTIDVRKIGTSPIDEGIFPEEIFEAIERRREQILREISCVVEKNRKNELSPEERRRIEIGKVESAIKMLILDVERIYAQTGTNCVQECSDMLHDLEDLQKRYKTRSTPLPAHLNRCIYPIMFIAVASLIGIIYTHINTLIN
ncbi:hypothetical protein NEFER03_0852 [Nematocida sp. LUAm3]|nr:hypothetical protein NEFER03_0852 [Nematocida sp. LUAm3]KAI5174870.1 hypothetical protein NEFER02_0970 [Nematocida sp. LUAm2]KAI5177532.1 hypothetical protein NEFER01_0782 [Nematocida sp. LUAm1]